MTGRPPNPSAVQQAKGAWLKDPNRKRTDATARRPLDPEKYPKNFTPHEIEMWHFIIDNALIGVLKNSDTLVVEAAAKLSAKLRYDDLSISQLLAVTSSLRQLLSLMGMTPSDRCRVTSEPTDAENEDRALDAFFATKH